MKPLRLSLGVLVLSSVTELVGFAAGRFAPQAALSVEPAEQHRWLQSLAGDYDGELSGMMGPSKAPLRTESVLGGPWNVSRFECTLMGEPVEGFEILGYDMLTKEFVSVWIDSMSTLPTTTRGTYDADEKMLTMRGTSRGMDGEEAEMVNVFTYGDDGMTYSMQLEGMPEPMMTVVYERRSKVR